MVDPRLRALLLELGVTDDELEGLAEGDLIGLAGDTELAAGLDLGLDELASATDRSPDEVRAIYLAMGLPPDALAGFGRADVELIRFLDSKASEVISEIAPQLMRVVGRLMARLAEAVVAAYVQDVEAHYGPEVDVVELAEQNRAASRLVGSFGALLPLVFRHHMWTAVRRQRAAQDGVTSPEILRQAIGFVDLVGFTAMSRSVSPAQLIAMIEEFEHRAFETASRHGGRIVKSIGDEVMVAAEEAATVVAIVLDLIANTAQDRSVAPRAGMSAGEVLFRLGDYYGQVVNLASRLVDQAVPGELLTDLVEIDSDEFLVVPAGRRVLKGFAEPVTVATIERADAPPAR